MAVSKSILIKMRETELEQIMRANRKLLAENTDLKIRIAKLERKIEWLQAFAPADGGNENAN